MAHGIWHRAQASNAILGIETTEKRRETFRYDLYNCNSYRELNRLTSSLLEKSGKT